ncbi:hypothetical protein SEA_APIARY_40 [Rhodococcus phage Apiary]|nr:hypothetical protein SEA_BRAXOADDIE_40 [Rhodococcus phage Braxoaddie]WNM67424.1 hypothetical protein SEA_POLYYUKI_40 [Rhodococcus phage Polyyuki]WNM69848.1 hypothetical protein SEA_APIARY_40 [Rhodococcus phage Apiary]
MAFQPIRLTHPTSRENVVADNAADYNNFVYRDGYVVAKDQSGLGGKDAVASDTSASAGATAPARPETAAEKRKREQEESATKADTNTN